MSRGSEAKRIDKALRKFEKEHKVEDDKRRKEHERKEYPLF